MIKMFNFFLSLKTIVTKIIREVFVTDLDKQLNETLNIFMEKQVEISEPSNFGYIQDGKNYIMIDPDYLVDFYYSKLVTIGKLSPTAMEQWHCSQRASGMECTVLSLVPTTYHSAYNNNNNNSNNDNTNDNTINDANGDNNNINNDDDNNNLQLSVIIGTPILIVSKFKKVF